MEQVYFHLRAEVGTSSIKPIGSINQNLKSHND